MGWEERVCSPLLWIAYIRGMHLELTDEQTEALIRELSHSIDGDRYPLSPRIVVLKKILGQLRPEPARPAPPPPKVYAPPTKGRWRPAATNWK
jgi:hypothetical protein